jgi:HlyD family secretion protein
MKPLHVAITVSAVAAAVWFGSSLFATEDPAGSIKGVAVRRGPLDITVLETGNLKAAKSVALRSEIEGNSTILYLIEEGVTVEAGALLVELDTTELVKERLQQEIVVRNADSGRVKAQQSLEIQVSQNTSDIAAAERQLEFARIDLVKYVDGDWKLQERQANDDILLAREELKRAEDQLTWSQKLFDDGFLTRTELEADQLGAQRAQIRLDQSILSLDILQRFDKTRQESTLNADIVEAERELERVKLQAAARLVDYEADLDSQTRKLELELEKLAKVEMQLGKSKITAPIAGMVVYAKQNSNRWSGGEPIAEGQQVRERQELITIPSADGMIVEASVHESVLEQVNVGQTVRITVEALPEREFTGRVRFKAVLPDTNSWWANPDLRVYRTEIEILNPELGMRPGMTCAVRVEVAKLENVLHVPVQARFFQGEQAVVFVRDGETISLRHVELGLYNEAWIEIKGGLEEGEIVLMSAPQGYDLSDAPPPAGRDANAEGELPVVPPVGGVPPAGYGGMNVPVQGGAAGDARIPTLGEGRPSFGGGEGRGERGGRKRGEGEGDGAGGGGAPEGAPREGATGAPREGAGDAPRGGGAPDSEGTSAGGGAPVGAPVGAPASAQAAAPDAAAATESRPE